MQYHCGLFFRGGPQKYPRKGGETRGEGDNQRFLRYSPPTKRESNLRKCGEGVEGT